MAIGKLGETLQAVVVKQTSTIGILTDDGGERSTVHVLEDCNLTFHFNTGDKTVIALAGSDWVAGDRCTGITSTAKVIID